MTRHVNDPYVKQAIDGDLRSRSAFKLIQLQRDYNLIKADSYVIDLGSAPGENILSIIMRIMRIIMMSDENRQTKQRTMGPLKWCV